MRAIIPAWIILGLFVISGSTKELAPLPELTQPTMIDIYDGELYVMEDCTVQVYSLKNFKLLRSFGKKGEGPGELLAAPEMPNVMQIYKGQVLVNSFNKMIYFSLSGEMKKEVRIPFLALQVVPFGENFAAVKFSREPDGSSKACVILYDQSFKEIKTLYENKLQNDMKKGRIAYPLTSVFLKCNGPKLYVFDQQVGFKIKIYDISGKELPTISLPYQQIPVSEAFKKNSMAWLRIQPAFKLVPQIVNEMIFFNEFLPVFRYSVVTKDTIYVQTYGTKLGLSEFYVLDLNGKLLDKIYLPGADRDQLRPSPSSFYTFQGDTYFYLTEDIEEEEWTFHMKKLKH